MLLVLVEFWLLCASLDPVAWAEGGGTAAACDCGGVDCCDWSGVLCGVELVELLELEAPEFSITFGSPLACGAWLGVCGAVVPVGDVSLDGLLTAPLF